MACWTESPLSLPTPFLTVLASPASLTPEDNQEKEATTFDLQITCMAHMLRNGVGSVVPQGAIALLSVEDVEFMLRGHRAWAWRLCGRMLSTVKAYIQIIFTSTYFGLLWRNCPTKSSPPSWAPSFLPK